MVPPRRFRSFRPPSVSSRRLLSPRLPAVPAAVLVAVLSLTCAVLGAGPAAAQPAVPVPPPGGGAVSVPLPPAPADAAPAEGVAAPSPNPAPAADPTPAPAPTDAAGAGAQLRQVQQEAEALTEQWHAAQDDVTARRAELDTLRGAIDPARAAAAAARGDEEHYREQVDTVALSTFESGRLDAFNALLASRTPQDYVDQMSALEVVAAQHASALDQLAAVADRARHVQDDADAAAARAQVAADEAAHAEQALAARKRDADRRIGEAEALLRRLTPRALQDYLGPDVDAPVLPSDSGSGVGVRALRAAAAQLGKAYQWGAEGPRSFDCSGLTSFSFHQAGITLPRSSSQQARVGHPVALGDLQPGDLVFFHSPVSHVGIYAGGGKMIHAPQTGDVVRYSTVSRRTFSGARRL
ncbi:MAG: C40 family peptidase [Pseudonocardia sp.]|nr:C40 family peptidase [Pseudonocardia sp.]